MNAWRPRKGTTPRRLQPRYPRIRIDPDCRSWPLRDISFGKLGKAHSPRGACHRESCMHYTEMTDNTLKKSYLTNPPPFPAIPSPHSHFLCVSLSLSLYSFIYIFQSSGPRNYDDQIFELRLDYPLSKPRGRKLGVPYKRFRFASLRTLSKMRRGKNFSSVEYLTIKSRLFIILLREANVRTKKKT